MKQEISEVLVCVQYENLGVCPSSNRLSERIRLVVGLHEFDRGMITELVTCTETSGETVLNVDAAKQGGREIQPSV
jgi:hypothetical protein